VAAAAEKVVAPAVQEAAEMVVLETALQQRLAPLTQAVAVAEIGICTQAALAVPVS
jgi:hypothetical protein